MHLAQDQQAFSGIEIPNPKLYADSISGQESRIYPYYAGYAASFAEATLLTMEPQKSALVLDPWNGSGTTTLAAAKLGYSAVGQDLNPVMVLVAKGSLLPASEASSLLPIANAILSSCRRMEPSTLANDPLATWLTPTSARAVRALETEINRTLAAADGYLRLTEKGSLDNISSLASLFYVALFRTTRKILRDFIPSNPTWVKKPGNLQRRKRPVAETIHKIFLVEVELLSKRLIPGIAFQDQGSPVKIVLGNAENIALPNESVDLIITSPPYCTRIDYAVSTSIELAVLRASANDFDTIRRSLMGTSTVSESGAPPEAGWGKTCSDFLNRVIEHPSKASKTYYFKNHRQYFNSLYSSIGELSRVLRLGGKAILVVQDSYYKEVRNDVALITTEMAEIAGLSLTLRKDFSADRSMSGLNGHAKKYRNNSKATESVLCFLRT